jgi:hypothetical protein
MVAAFATVFTGIFSFSSNSRLFSLSLAALRFLKLCLALSPLRFDIAFAFLT